MKKSILLKEAILVFVTMIWSGGFIAQVLGGTYLGTYSLIFCRTLIAELFVGCVILVMDGIKKHRHEDYQESDKKGLWKGGLIIGVSTAVAMIFQQIGVMSEGAGKAGFITTLYIIIVPVIGLFLGHRVNKWILVSIVLGVAGLYLINVNGGSFNLNFGTIMLLCSALCYAIQILLIDKFSKGYNVTKLTFIQFISILVITLPLMLIFEDLSWANFMKALSSLLYLSIGSTGLTSILQMYAQKEVDVTVASIIMSLESVFSVIMGVIMLHESHTLIQYIGCILLFSAVIFSQLSQRITIKKVELK